jgi:hypothetical protein
MAIAFRAAATNSGTDSSAEVTLPSGSAQNDIIVAMVSVASNSGKTTNAAHTWPSGWNVLNTDGFESLSNSRSIRVSVAWHKFTTGDAAPSVTVTTPTVGAWGSLSMGYSGADGTTPFLSYSHSILADLTAATNTGTTPTATDSTAGLWPVSMFSFFNLTAPTCSYTSGASSSERGEINTNASSWDVTIAGYDSNATVDASGGVSTTVTSAANAMGWFRWIGLLQPSQALPPVNSVGILLG